MIYTKEQAAEAIRQHPELARQLRLSPSEMIVLKAINGATRMIDLCSTKSVQNVSRSVRGLIEKGYIKRIKTGEYERVI